VRGAEHADVDFETDPELAQVGWRVPLGRPVELAGRGTTFVREVPGPPKAPVLLLLHGLSASSGLNWFACFETLGQHFRVIALDHRGHGRGIRSSTRFRLVDCADDAVALADALGVERFIPVGYSMGGPISQLIWHRHAARVEALVMCATSRNFRGNVRERVQFMALGMALAGRWAPVPNREAGRILRLIESTLTPDMGHPGLGRWIAHELSLNDSRRVVEAAEALGRYSSHEWIDHISVPTSVVVTSHDQLVPVRRQVKLAQAIPSAVIFPVEGDHLVCARDPGAFVPVLLDACQLAATRAARRRAPTRPRLRRAAD
jgi:3-oxoadipate enol-lactonase